MMSFYILLRAFQITFIVGDDRWVFKSRTLCVRNNLTQISSIKVIKIAIRTLKGISAISAGCNSDHDFVISFTSMRLPPPPPPSSPD